MKAITVFCSASKVQSVYKDAAIAFGQLMVGHGYDLVWGGSNTGLMKAIADSVQDQGGKLIGISVPAFAKISRKTANEMIVADNLLERKNLLLARGDAVALLPGGIGSLDEITHVLELKKQNQHKKPIVVLNTNNFYEGLYRQLQRMDAEKMLFDKKLAEFVYFTDNTHDAIDYIDNALTS